MEIVDNKTQAPLVHHKELFEDIDPYIAAARCDIKFDDGVFTLTFLGKKVNVEHPEFRAYYDDTKAELPDVAAILLIRYILNGFGSESSGKFMSYSEMPWGNVYLSNFKGRCIARLAYSFGFDLQKFHNACTSIGGVFVKGGDASYDIELLKGYVVRLIILSPDEEDEKRPGAQILFSDNFCLAFTAEDMAVVGDILIDALKGISNN